MVEFEFEPVISGVGSGVAPGAGAPPCWRALA